MITKVFRFVFTLLGMLFGYGVSTFVVGNVQRVADLLGDYAYTLFVPLIIVLFGIIFYSYYSILITRGEKIAKSFIKTMEKVPLSEVATGTIGLVAGLVIAYLISQIIYGIEVLKATYIATIVSVILYIGFGYTGMLLGRRGSSEIKGIIPVANLARETVKKKGKYGLAPKILDTSVIIDGRIIDILKTGFLDGDIIIPDFVLVELRHIADSSDDLKRARGRRGLDILAKIESDYGIDIYETSNEKVLDDIPEVDVKLLKLSQISKGVVVTNDYNLNKVATVLGIKVLNINDLANALKPVVLPGEAMNVYLVKAGKEDGQAVAYLDDGTMVVVEDGKMYIGKTINVNVTSVLQTSAGKMIFAKP